MNFGFDPLQFRLNRIPAPDWALTMQSKSPALSEPVRHALTEELPDMDQATERYLQWAMTDPVATARFQDNHTYADGVVGDYFIGRRHFDLDEGSPDRVIVETECCLTSLNYQSLPAIYQRYLVVLSWNLSNSTSNLILAHDTERDSHLSVLSVSPICSETLSDIPDQDDLSEEHRLVLTSRWTEFLTCVQEAAQEAIDHGSASGQVDDSFFPCRLTMTGHYRIEQIHSQKAEEINVSLYFTELQRMASRGEDDYFGYELSVFFGGDRMRSELWGGRAL